MFSIGLGMTLRRGGYEGYKKAHDECWPELLENQRVSGVSMVIYKWGDRLFVHATAPSEAAWLKTREGPLVDKWHEYMTKFLETDEQGKVQFELLEPAFRFGVFEDDWHQYFIRSSLSPVGNTLKSAKLSLRSLLNWMHRRSTGSPDLAWAIICGSGAIPNSALSRRPMTADSDALAR